MLFVAETRLQEDCPEGRAADARGGPADREPERAMTISQPQFTQPLAQIRREEEREGGGSFARWAQKVARNCSLLPTKISKGMKVAEFIHFGDFFRV